MLACCNIVTISGTKDDGEARVLNSREWHEAVFRPRNSFRPFLFFFPLPSLSFYCEGARRRPARGKRVRRHGRVGADGRRENDAQWAFFWKIKVQRRQPRCGACVGQRLALKLKSQAKTYGREQSVGSGGWEGWRGRGRSGVLACNLKASRCFSHGPKEAIRIPAGDR